MNDLFSLAGKVILITGASRGLGWAMAQAMSAAGGHVVLNGRDPKTLETRAARLRKTGSEVSIAAFDVTDEAAGARAIADIAAEHGSLDVLVANAGIQHREALEDFTTEDFKQVVDTNLTACFTLARAAAAQMRRRGAGRIIMTASIMGQVARPTISAYTAAKGGVMALVKALAVELGPEGITCNAIAPGFIATEMTMALLENEEFNAWVESRTPLGRWGRPEEIAGAAVFLASPAGAYVNGHVLNVDGGMVINA